MASPGGTFWFRKRKSEGVKVTHGDSTKKNRGDHIQGS